MQNDQLAMQKATELLQPHNERVTEQHSADSDMQPKSENYQSSELHTSTMSYSTDTNREKDETLSKLLYLISIY